MKGTSVSEVASARLDPATSAEALLPGLVKERKRALWQLGKLRVLDGGPDGDADTGPNTLFAAPGLFVP